MNNSTKAVTAPIDLGFTQIQGLMLPDGSYCVAVPQLAEAFQSNPNTFSRDLKRLMGSSFSPSKIKTELGKQLINVVSVSDASKIAYILAKKENPIADAFVQAILEEGLERRFDTAFGKKVTEAEYNALIALRMKRILARRIWTDTLRDRSLQLYGIKPDSDSYKRWTVKVNQRLFSKRHFFCNRDNMNQLEQELIELFERMAERKAKLNPKATPGEVIELALLAFE